MALPKYGRSTDAGGSVEKTHVVVCPCGWNISQPPDCLERSLTRRHGSKRWRVKKGRIHLPVHFTSCKLCEWNIRSARQKAVDEGVQERTMQENVEVARCSQERLLERISEQIVDVSIRQFQDVGESIDVLMPRIAKETVHEIMNIPQQCISQRMAKQMVDVTV